jgi:uncharacterized protein DUF1488
VPLHRMDHSLMVHEDPPGLVFWMKADSGAPVRVFVTKQALHIKLDNNSRQPSDQVSGLQIFKEHRDRIEEAASRKFDAQGVTGQLDGEPALIVGSDDL